MPLTQEKIRRLIDLENQAKMSHTTSYTRPDFTVQDGLDLLALGTFWAPWVGNATSVIADSYRVYEKPSKENLGQLGITGGFVLFPFMGILSGAKGARNARTLTRLEEAKAMVGEGASPELTWRSTGWALDPRDGQWKWEINDAGSTINYGVISRAKGEPLTLEQVLNHPALFEAYPELRSYRIDAGVVSKLDEELLGRSFRFGEQNPKTRTIKAMAPEGDVFHRTLLHEIQHAVQDIEDFGRGSYVSDMSFSQFKNNYDEARRNWAMYNTVDIYKSKLDDVDLSSYEDVVSTLVEALPEATNIDSMALNLAIKELRETSPEEIWANKTFRNMVNDRFQYFDEVGRSLKDHLASLPGEPALLDAQEFLGTQFYRDYMSVAGEVEARNVEFRWLSRINNQDPQTSMYRMLEAEATPSDPFYLDRTLTAPLDPSKISPLNLALTQRDKTSQFYIDRYNEAIKESAEVAKQRRATRRASQQGVVTDGE